MPLLAERHESVHRQSAGPQPAESGQDRLDEIIAPHTKSARL